jgi:hypothetical protein
MERNFSAGRFCTRPNDGMKNILIELGIPPKMFAP